MRLRIATNNMAEGARIKFLRTNPLLLRRIFSSRVLKDLANKKLPPELASVLDSLEKEGQLPEALTLSDLYNAAFKFCFRHQRVEYFYKNAIVEKLVLGRRSLSTTAAYTEVRVEEAKLDVLLASNCLSAYEIKTDFDELARLPSQLQAYQRACREVSVVTGERYAASVEKLIAPEVGLLVLTDRYQLRAIRPASKSDLTLSRSTMLALLRRGELVRLLGDLGCDTGSIPNTRIYQEALAASVGMTRVSVNEYVAKQLLIRSSSKGELVRGLPTSLAASALAQDLTHAQIVRLIELFDMDVTGGIQSELLPVFSR